MIKALCKFISAGVILFPITQASAHVLKFDHPTRSGVHIQIAENKDIPKTKDQKEKDENLKGPKKSKGIKEVRVVGKYSLKGQLDNIDNRELRARFVEIEPGGIVAVHRHGQNPGPAIAYMISGALTEFRQGEKPIVRKAGDAALEYKGTVHWWRNDGSTNAKALVVDIPISDVK